MVKCPRCGDDVEQLHSLPPETCTEETDAPGDAEQRDDAQACRWCLHEINEG